MRLVLIVDYKGGYDCSGCTETWPIIHTSKDEATLEYLSKIDKIEKSVEKYNEEYDKWVNSFLKKKEGSLDKLPMPPSFPYTTINFAGHDIEYSDIYVNDTKILTLDEWYATL